MANRAFFARLNKFGASPRRARRRAEGIIVRADEKHGRVEIEIVARYEEYVRSYLLESKGEEKKKKEKRRKELVGKAVRNWREERAEPPCI